MARNDMVTMVTSGALSSEETAVNNLHVHASSAKRTAQEFPCLVPTVTKTAVPQVFHEPHVETGFRQIHQPWSYYLFSVFQVHNECMNVWTHLIALVAAVYRFYVFSMEFDMVNDPYMWPLGTYFLSTFILYIFSSGAHCFCSRSEIAHYTCFLMDYAGIGIQGLGSTIAHYWYCMHEDIFDTFPHRFAAPVGVLLSSVVCLCCSTAKVYYVRPYPFTRRLWQIGSCMAIYSWLILPIMYQVYLHLFHSYWEPSLGDHIQQVLWFICGGFFFSSDIPQRLFPGCFDFVGHGHQIFHLCIMMTTLKQLDAIYKDIAADRENLYASVPPTLLGTYGAAVIGLIVNLGLVFVFQLVIRRKLAGNVRKEQ
ncbi:membrane progestin receptor beta-like [Babylonia areolata]|uniref:membrane progestin receptor beta-like n=1 Tax=Babylonia areolata TaxID=304850 RepID=UPI003FD5A6A6